MVTAISRTVSFLAAVWLFWWSMPLHGLALYLKWFKFTGGRNDVFTWSRFLMDCLFAKVRLVGKQRILSSSRPVMYLANHRSWGDFFIDVFILGGRGMVMARMAVCYAFPVVMIPASLSTGILLFKRNLVRDKDAFNAWLDEKRKQAFQNNLLVYPEGHRNTDPAQLLPLKRGMLHYAFTRKMLVQVCMSTGKERVLSEKKLGVGFGVDIVTSFSKPIDPNDYEDAASFIAEVQQTFQQHWETVLRETPNAASLPVYSPTDDAVEHYDYPAPMRMKMVALQMSFSAALFAMLYASYKLAGKSCSIAALLFIVACIRHNFVQTRAAAAAKSKAE